MRPQPVLFEWKPVDVADDKTGEVRETFAMVPGEKYRRIAERQFGSPGSEHVLAPYEGRNMEMHKATFAELNELYQNLPEAVWYVTKPDGSFRLDDKGERIVRFPSFDHFRYWLLIEENFCVEWYCEAASPRAALAIAKNLRLRFTHARIRIEGSTVVVREAESQAIGAMGKQKFADSMDAILARARSYVGVTAATSRKYAGRSA